MRLTPTRWHLLLALGAILLAAAGCYQQAGNAVPQPTPIAQSLPTDTPPPTNTEPPTATETPDAALLGQGGAEVTDQALFFATPTSESIAQVPTLPTDLAETATTTFLLTQDPLYVTATAFILSATQTVSAQLTGIAPVIPTFTPPPTLGAAPVGTTPQPIQPGGTCIHEVAVGDNLYRISLRYGLTVREIAAANGIVNINVIVVGQKLNIPGCGTTGAVPPATSTADPGSGGGGDLTTTSSSICGPTYVVEQGETLFQISLKCGVSVSAIAARNGIANINLIYLGQELSMP